MIEHCKRYRIDFTVDVHNEGVTEDWDWSNANIKNFALQELECMSPFPFNINFSEVKGNWNKGIPTEKGQYLIYDPSSDKYIVAEFDGSMFIHAEGIHCIIIYTHPDSVVWQKIEPYEDNKNESNDLSANEWQK